MQDVGVGTEKKYTNANVYKAENACIHMYIYIHTYIQQLLDLLQFCVGFEIYEHT
jgi:hypothetical protein